MKKTSKKVIAVTLSASMLLGGSMTAMAATTNPDISQREIDHKTAAKNIAAQGMVLMENKNNSLPISAKKGTKVALFGQGVYNTIKGGTGSGAVNQRDNVTVLPQLSVIIVISHVPQLCFKQLPATSSIHCTFYHF